MAVIKIPQSQQQVRAAGQSGSVDIRLPLSLAQQQGAALSSLGKVYEDIYKEQREIEDKKSLPSKISKESWSNSRKRWMPRSLPSKDD